MRWLFLHLWLCALLLVQQPSVLVLKGSALQAPGAATVGSQGSGAGQVSEEEEEKVPGLRSVGRSSLNLRASNSREVPPVPVMPVRREASGTAPQRCDVAVAHWRAALLPPPSLSEEPPQRA